MNKKIISSLLFVSIVFPTLFSCSIQSNDGVVDRDFDGLINLIDPDPDNNEYAVTLVNEQKGKEPFETGELHFVMDYRNFIKTGYQKDLAKLASICINDSYSKYVPNFKNNRYPSTTDESLVCPTLTQIGCDNITKINMGAEAFSEDIYDVADIYVGHHTFSIGDGSKYQIFFAIIMPYINMSGWASNLDVGAANLDGSLTDGYKLFAGDSHSEWLDKVNHKGFDVTSNRVFNRVKEYEENYKDNSAHQITFITGHSRGGAITNLVAKRMIDEGFDVRAFAFNPPNNTQHPESLIKDEKYNNIHNFVNNTDFVSLVPSSQWGFDIFGNNTYRIDINKDLFRSFMKTEYEPNSLNALTNLDNLIANFATNKGVVLRENLYEFRDPSPDPTLEEAFVFEGFDAMNQAHKYYDGLTHYFEHSPEAKTSFEFNEPIETKLNEEAKIYYRTKPALIIALILDLLGRNEFSSIFDYIDVMRRYIGEFFNYFGELDFGEFTIAGVKLAHEQPIACVMAEQYEPS